MSENVFAKQNEDISWCPGCGNFKILDTLTLALSELGLNPLSTVVSSGIGQAPKTPHYFNTNMFNGLHGRALCAAVAIKASNPSLTVIAEGGDGDMYGEGGNHFIHNIRRNPNILHLVHDNMVYGLTKGQASPTSQVGFVTPVQVDGVSNEPVNPMALAIGQNASFVARALSSDVEQTKEIFKKALLHKGYALVDVLQPCVTFNKTNTYKWFKENTYYLDESYDPTNRVAAFEKAIETSKMPLGILYLRYAKTFEEQCGAYDTDSRPLFEREFDSAKLTRAIMSFAE